MKKSRYLLRGLRDGIPIGAGYFAVSFALGIAAKRIGMTAFPAGLMSAGMMASAGEFAALLLISSGAGVLEMVFTCVIVNLRYFLMSCSLSQKLRPEMPLFHRFLLAHTVTDEIFGLSVAVEGYLEPVYTYGIWLVSAFGWTSGTVLGVLMGSILPAWAVNALSVSLYGMFLAIIIPPAKKNRFIGLLVAASMLASWVFSILPLLREISSGFRVIILTVALSALAAVIRPLPEEV